MPDKSHTGKLHRIILFYLFFSGILPSLVIFGGLGFLKGLIPTGTVDYYLCQFDERVARFNAAPPPRVVIVGTCYAAFLGDSDAIYNLGLATGTSDEQYSVARKYISSEDTVLYVFGLLELVGGKESKNRLITHHDYLRRIFLAHSALSTFLTSFVGMGAPPIASPLPDSRQTEMLRAASGLDDIPDTGNFLKYVRYFSNDRRTLTLKHLEDFKALHANTIFLYHPPLRISAVGGNDEFAERLRRVSQIESQAEEMLKRSSFPYIDLTPRVDKNDYADLLHLTRKSSVRIFKELPTLLANKYDFGGTEKPVPLESYKYGANIEFGRNGNYFEYEGAGWSDPEAGFTWTNGQSASLTIPIEKADSDIELKAMLSPFIVAGKLDKQEVNIYVNNRLIGQWVVTKPAMSLWQRAWNKVNNASRFQERTVTIPGDLLSGSNARITFELPDATAPSKLGVIGGKRILGIAVHRIVLAKSSDSVPLHK